MHRRTRVDLLPLDTKIEKKLINLKKEKAAKIASSMGEQGKANQNILVAAERRQ